jgi:hypothetical protein
MPAKAAWSKSQAVPVRALASWSKCFLRRGCPALCCPCACSVWSRRRWSCFWAPSPRARGVRFADIAMPPVQPDGLNPRRGGQFADLCGCGLHHIGASEIVPTGQAIQTEAFQGLSDLRQGPMATWAKSLILEARCLRNAAAGGGSISRGDVAFPPGREGALTGGRADSTITDRVSPPWLSCRKATSSALRIAAIRISPFAEEVAWLTGRPPSQDRSPCSRTRHASSCNRADYTPPGTRPPGSRSCHACVHAPKAQARRTTRTASR